MRFLVVDDHPLLREGVAAALRQFDPAAEVLQASNGAHALALIEQQTEPLDLVLVDLCMDELNGLQTVQRLQQLHPGLPSIVLSSSEDPADVRQALRAGARGYCPKSAGFSTLLAALRLVLGGEVYVPPLMAAVALPPEAASAQADRLLTERQLTVLRLLCAGQPNKVISRELGLSEKTTKAHVTAIFKALGVVNRTQAVLAATSRGLLGDQRSSA
jgi:DNA-binding NarL/FixJ family response regulator